MHKLYNATDSIGCFKTFLIANQPVILVGTVEVIKLQMAAELPAILVHSILEIVKRTSSEGENVKFI